ncbi:MAG TPA: MFS transporter, partial [Thermomicrobiales bacterium]|nr:MFS transporter [Thermomicrobiales bacterium]
LAAFVRVESRSRSLLVPAAALRNRTMVAADLAAFLLFAGFFSFIFLGSLLMQQLLSYSPTRTGVAWLATSLTAFVAAGFAGAKLVSLVGIRRLLVVGMLLLTVSAAWLSRVPVGADYLPDLLPAFLLGGFAIGLSAPTIQIGALSNVSGKDAGLASGLVETMREIGGAVGIAAVSTVLIARAGVSEAAAFNAFQSAFVVILVLAALGALIALIAFPRAVQGVPVPTGEEALVRPEASPAD